MTAVIATSPKFQFSAPGVGPLINGTLTTYVAGTTTPTTTWQDRAQATANTNPIVLDGNGECLLWLDPLVTYKFVLANEAGAQQWSVDNVDGAASAVDFATYVASLTASSGSSLIGFIQAGFGAVARTVQAKLRESVSVMDFGAVGNGVADDTAAIQAALDYCETSGAHIQGVPGTYKTTSTLVIKCSGDMSAMTINANAALFSPAVQVGPATAGQYLFDADLKLPLVINTAKIGSGWVGFENSIGVYCANVYQSRITVPSIYNFGVGLKTGGYGVGNVYNTYNIGVLFGNKINLQCKPGDAGGWSNQNTYIGGRYGYSSSEGTEVSGVMQIQLRDFDATGPGAPNNNLWLNPSIEGNEPEFHLDIQGTFNNFINPRFEVGTGIPARVNFHAITTNETLCNNLIGGYDISCITYTSSGAGTSARNKRIGGSFSDSYEFSGNGINLVNKTGSSRNTPHIQGFLATQTALGKNETSTDWIYRLHGDGLSIKSTGDAQDRIQTTAAGYLNFGRGGSAPTAGFRAGTGGEVNAQSALQPETDNTFTLGAASRRWSEVRGVNIFAGTAKWTSGTGSPEGVVAAPMGSIYSNTGGGAGVTLYVKESGSAGNTGWVAK